MDFTQYQMRAITTLRPHQDSILTLARLTLGLSGEAGEVAEKVKKFMRDTDMSQEKKVELANMLSKELGDVLWYLASIAYELNLGLDNIAEENISKLAKRKIELKISGSGDER